MSGLIIAIGERHHWRARLRSLSYDLRHRLQCVRSRHDGHRDGPEGGYRHGFTVGKARDDEVRLNECSRQRLEECL